MIYDYNENEKIDENRFRRFLGAFHLGIKL